MEIFYLLTCMSVISSFIVIRETLSQLFATLNCMLSKEVVQFSRIFHKTFGYFLCLYMALSWSIFELEKCSFFLKQVRISPEIDQLSVSYAGKSAL